MVFDFITDVFLCSYLQQEDIIMVNNGWKRIVIKSLASLKLSENCLVITMNNETTSIPLQQIDTLIIESEQVNITSALLIALVEKNVNVIFCDKKHNPLFETTAYSQNKYSTERLNEQISWDINRKAEIGQKIIKLKIQNQANLLRKYALTDYIELEKLINSIDSENCLEIEGQAAKLYFHSLFGIDFFRRTENNINFGLNYGYSILLSIINRSIISHGYNTSLGLNHHNCKNQFNFSCDIIEPFRPFVDEVVFENMDNEFNIEYKKELISIGLKDIKYNNSIISLENAIDLFVLSIIRRMNDTLNLCEVIDFA